MNGGVEQHGRLREYALRGWLVLAVSPVLVAFLFHIERGGEAAEVIVQIALAILALTGLWFTDPYAAM